MNRDDACPSEVDPFSALPSSCSPFHSGQKEGGALPLFLPYTDNIRFVQRKINSLSFDCFELQTVTEYTTSRISRRDSICAMTIVRYLAQRSLDSVTISSASSGRSNWAIIVSP